jgi:alkanesulfonate monooxygenase SsuD/methylene tetrahydromethanopterin reductase-like flavin-dependent oxidoreductase (luciferase family)
MPVGDLREDIHAEPFAELHHPLLMAGGAKMATLAGKRQQILMAAIFALHAGKAVVQITAVKIAMNHLLHVGPPETILT